MDILILLESNYQIRIVVMLYVQMIRNRKWKIQDGGLLNSITYISACTQDSNEIRSATSPSSAEVYIDKTDTFTQ